MREIDINNIYEQLKNATEENGGMLINGIVKITDGKDYNYILKFSDSEYQYNKVPKQ